jgi:hypothetical protein
MLVKPGKPATCRPENKLKKRDRVAGLPHVPMRSLNRGLKLQHVAGEVEMLRYVGLVAALGTVLSVAVAEDAVAQGFSEGAPGGGGGGGAPGTTFETSFDSPSLGFTTPHTLGLRDLLVGGSPGLGGGGQPPTTFIAPQFGPFSGTPKSHSTVRQ